MASLRDMLNLGGGQLATTSLEEAQRLSGQQQAPTSPMQASVLGASPHAAKMAGTAGQKIPALRAAIQGNSDSLDQRQALQQPSTQATQGQQQEVANAANAQSLSSLGSRVQEISQQQISSAVQAATAQAQGGQVNVPTTLPQAQQDALNALVKNPNDQSALANLSTALGHQATQDDINQLLGGATAEAGIGGASAGANVKSVTGAQLPSNLQQTASQLLGHDVSNMSMDQLIQNINQEIQKDYSTVSGLQQQLSDPATGAAQRAQIRSQLQGMGAVGVTSAESSMDKIADGLQNAETITFNGQQVPLNQLLSSDYVSGLVSNYLQDPTSATSQTLQQQEPDLVNMIKQYQPVLEAAIGNLGQGVGQFAATTLANGQMNQVNVGNGATQTLSDDIMKQLVPTWGQYTGTKIDPNSNGILGFLSSPGAATSGQAKTVVDTLTALQAANPALVQQMAGWSQGQVQQYLANNGNKIQAMLTQQQQLSKIDPTNFSSNDVASLYGFGDANTMQKAVTDMLTKSASGLYGATASPASMGITVGKDGNINWAATLASAQKASPTDLKGLVMNTPDSLATQATNNITSYNSKTLSNEQQSAYNAAAPALAPGANLNTAQQTQVVNNMSMDDIAVLAGTPAWNKLPANLQNQLLQKQSQQIGTHIDSLVAANSSKSYNSLSDAMKALGNPAGNATDKASVDSNIQSVISKLQDTSRSTRANGEVLNEKAIDTAVASLQDRLKSFDTASTAAQNTVSTATDAATLQYVPYQTFGALVTSLNNGSFPSKYDGGIDPLVSNLQNASRAARSAGNTVLMSAYDAQISQLQQAFATYSQQQQANQQSQAQNKKAAQEKSGTETTLSDILTGNPLAKKTTETGLDAAKQVAKPVGKGAGGLARALGKVGL